MSDIDKIRKAMFDVAKVELTPKEAELKHRYMDLYTQMLSHSFKSDNYFIRYLHENYNIKRSQAYRDIAAVKILLGNVTNAAKEFQRFTAIEMVKRGYELADDEGADRADIKRAEVMIRAATTLGKITQLDKEDVEKKPWDEIIPQSFEVTGDVSVLGRKKIPNLDERKAKLRKELFGNITPEEATIIDDEE